MTADEMERLVLDNLAISVPLIARYSSKVVLCSGDDECVEYESIRARTIAFAEWQRDDDDCPSEGAPIAWTDGRQCGWARTMTAATMYIEDSLTKRGYLLASRYSDREEATHAIEEESQEA